jgi:hypothetical protein
MSGDKVFITPDDWGLLNSDRTTVRQGTDRESGRDWFYITYSGGITFALHKEEISLLYKFTCVEADNAD